MHKWIRIMREYIKIKFSLFLGVSIRHEYFMRENFRCEIRREYFMRENFRFEIRRECFMRENFRREIRREKVR